MPTFHSPRAPNAAAIQQLGEDLALRAREQRRCRSLRTCHRPALRPQAPAYNGNSAAFVPQIAARVFNDPGLTDGARRCAVKLMELVYRRNRERRHIGCTVSYLAKCLGRSERTIQNYLCQLRGRGYIRHEVVTSNKARMCIGIFITLLRPMFPRHHSDQWPQSAGKSGVQPDSQNYIQNNNKRFFRGREDVQYWTLKCMDGVFRAFMKTQTPARVGFPSGQ